MKKVLFIGAFVLTSSFAFSQEKPHQPRMNSENWEEKHQEMKDKMAKELSLTEEQRKQINAIDERYKTQEETLRTQGQALREQSKNLRDKKREEVEKVLTADQKQKLKDMKEKFQAKREGKKDVGPKKKK